MTFVKKNKHKGLYCRQDRTGIENDQNVRSCCTESTWDKDDLRYLAN